MEKDKFDDRNGLWYELQGDYYLPDLKFPDEENKPIGLWGQRHARHLKQNHKVLYMNLLTSGKLNSYLADIDQQADEMFDRLTKQMVIKGRTYLREHEQKLLKILHFYGMDARVSQ